MFDPFLVEIGGGLFLRNFFSFLKILEEWDGIRDVKQVDPSRPVQQRAHLRTGHDGSGRT